MVISLLAASNSHATFFTPGENGCLSWDTTTGKGLPSLPWQCIRIVGLGGKEWHVDLVVEVDQV